MEGTTSNKLILPAQFTARAATMTDIETAVSLFNTCAIATTGAPETTVNELRTEWGNPHFDLPTATRVVLSADGQLVGYLEVHDTAPIPVTSWIWGCVHPDYERQGIGTYLMIWGEQRVRQAVKRCPDDARVVVRCNVLNTHTAAQKLLTQQGMTIVRHSWRMVIEFDEAPHLSAWPAGLTLKTFADMRDLTAVYQAVSESFQDHWGHVEQPIEEGIKEWQYWTEHDEDFDPALWLLAMDGDEIAGFSLCRQHADDDADMGWIGTLGVRRSWRRRGLGLALLQQSFIEMHKRGRLRVGLGVDAGSLTGATRLYEKAGMKVSRQYHAYEKELRPGRDITRR